MKQFTPPEFLISSNIYEVNIRQYTKEGTFNAFAVHLPRLHKMGVEILWLMPIHPIGKIKRKGTLGSYYSIQNHKGVNPEFGSENDLKNLILKAHSLGMKVILDWVANHAAWDNVWTISNPDFFVRDGEGFVSPFDWTDVIQIDHSNFHQQEAMKNCMAYWIEQFDIDGFRADLAHLTPLGFWVDARKRLSPLKENLIWLAETEDETYCAAFDITFTWRWMHLAEDALKTENATEVLKSFLQTDTFPGYRLYFTSNHDENSWNGTAYEKYGIYTKALAAFSCLYPKSIPLIYSGEESANTKRLEFFEKDEIDWDGYQLEKFYTELLKIRKSYSVFKSTESTITYLDYLEILAFRISVHNSAISVYLNFSKTNASFVFNSELYNLEPGEWIYFD
ncbi:MAG: alpha-amylase family glycosyl hydrolase [Ferruginibacter sp.]